MGKLQRKRRVPSTSRQHLLASEPPGEGGPDEAASFIAETAAHLVRLARRHRLIHLRYLLALVQLDAEEHVRLRSRRRLP